ncbi:Regulator of telomere elongation helicase 1 [Seminavis robusta]|uniref:Regulator of telomere elongation helicase 1 n=1 Tax=Seminavis robusta TaxID=568900 RepID=A0A9N8EKW2_9STRA|nr:Regulator of telomere elongation helicase 1 [Seminavis robusta]|eukprot:Sro1149_g246570.1 Regulator of telomere elongation helicase 1 (1595) ;mRNA; r:15602-20386
MKAVGAAKSHQSRAVASSRKRKGGETSPTSVELRGVTINFPFKPYKCQEDYMGKVLDALIKGQNALLESPTGTGKTLCLLCATLAWQRGQAKRVQEQAAAKAVARKSETVSGGSQDPAGGADNNPKTEPDTPDPMKVDPEDDDTDAVAALEKATLQKAPTRVPTIIYASRTHSQLSQVVRELRNTMYRPKHAVLGSREQMCVHPKVKKSSTTSAFDINHDCNALAKERKCRYRNQLEGFAAPSQENEAGRQPVLDMEDLVLMGKTHKVCPFYYTRSLVADAELVLMPYNYLFDKDARETTLQDIAWKDAVVIFDEAHNLESFATESASFDLSNTDIAMCIGELERALRFIDMMGEDGEDSSAVKRVNVERLKSLFLALENHILNLPYSGAHSGELMMKIFTDGISINYANYKLFVDEVRRVCQFLMDVRSGGGGGSNSKGAPKLEMFIQCVKRVFGESSEALCFAKAKSYRVHVTPKGAQQQQKQQQGRGNNNTNANGRTVSYWCFAPSLAMQELEGLDIRSILVTSGTLSPLPSYSMELGLHFPHTLENPHIIADEQIHVRVIGKGVSGKELTSSFQRRKDAEYYSELGNTLVSLAKVIPDGMLIFFPSYSVMETCLERWGCPAVFNNNSKKGGSKATASFFAARNKKGRNSSSRQQYSFPFTAPSIYGNSFGGGAANPNTPWKRLIGAKSVVVEPRSTADLPDAMAEFHKYLNMPKSKGVCLMGICRGKISEGIDFAGKQSRAVVITGLPFPPAFDPKVKLKREYLDSTRAAKNMKSAEAGGFGGSSTDISNGSEKKSKMTATGKTNVLSGHEWYSQQAHRAVNQAIGRVIRNRTDYGSVLLLDSRYAQPGNQQGLSKWVRPHVRPDQGVGTAIGELVKFYRTAAATAKEREDASKKIALEYEEEEEEAYSKRQKQKSQTQNADETFTKVAFVQNLNRDLNQVKANLKSAGPHPDTKVPEEGDKEEDPVTYISPGKVVARVDLDAVVQKKEPVFDGSFKRSSDTVKTQSGAFFAASKAPSRPTATKSDQKPKVAKSSGTNASTSTTNRPTTTAPTENRDSKNAAAQFFKKAQKWFTAAEFKTIRKSLVAMKQHGDKDDRKSYLLAAREVVKLCCQREHFFGQHEKDHGETMLFLFFQVLPAARRMEVELLAMKGLFKKSTLGQLCKENLPPEQYTTAIAEFRRFLHILWCGQVLTDKAMFLKEAEKVMTHLKDKNDTVSSDLASAFAKLVPERFNTGAQAIVSEMNASRNIQRIKTSEAKMKGEESIDNRRFQRPMQFQGALQPLAFSTSSRDEPNMPVIKSEQMAGVPTAKDRKLSSQLAPKHSSQGSHSLPTNSPSREPKLVVTKKLNSDAPRTDKVNASTKPQSSTQGRSSAVVPGIKGSSQSSAEHPTSKKANPYAKEGSLSRSSSSRGHGKVNPYAKKAKSLSSYTRSLTKSSDEKAAKKTQQVPNQAKPNRPAPAYKRTSELSKVGKPLPRSKKTTSSSDSVSHMLRQAEASPFVKKTTGDLVKSLKSNVPSNVHCVVCIQTAQTPMLSDCGHMACKDCWLQWLQRSETCPTCKESVKPRSLSRVVFQDGKAEDNRAVPTLSQLCD